MSRRRNPLTFRIRTLLREQRYEEVRPLLQELQEKDALHPLLATARRCMENGTPLPEPERRKTQRGTVSLKNDLAAFAAGEAELGRWRYAHLLRVCRNNRAAVRALPDELRPHVHPLRLAARTELRRRCRPVLLRGLALVSAALSTAALYGIYFHLQERAEHAADAMTAALNSGSVHAEQQALLLHDAGIHRLFSRRVGFSADALRQRLQAQQTRREELEVLLDELETGDKRVSDLPLHTRATAELTLSEQGDAGGKLKQRWERCCEQDAQALREQKARMMEQLLAPIPPLPTMVERPAADMDALQTYLGQLRKRRELQEEAEEAYEIPDTAAIGLQQAEADAQELLQEVSRYRDLLALLPSAHSYDFFRSLLGKKPFRCYAPGCRVTERLPRLPEEATILAAMQAYGHGNKESDTVARLLQGSPTFHADNAATQEQLHIMDELFSNRALQQRLWEISAPGKPVVFTAEEPQLRGDSVRIRRSGMDPQKRVSDAEYLTWDKPESVWKRCIDTRPLAEAALLERETFFTNACLPAVLTAVLNVPAPCAPALARAYVYGTLLQVLEQMGDSETVGLRHSPSLQAHIADFRRLKASLGIRLDGVCWLRTDTATRSAEERCAEWFSKRAGKDYAGEIRRTLTAYLQVEPLYCGYVNDAGAPVFCIPPAEGENVWFVRADGVTYGTSVDSALPFTPLFLLRKR